MKANKKPCGECPYRKNSIEGWLGEDSHNPTRFLQQLEGPMIHPCHKAVDYEQSSEEVDEQSINAPRCAGALQFMNNSLMLSKYKEVAQLQKELGKNPDVMQFKHNFIKHHER